MGCGASATDSSFYNAHGVNNGLVSISNSNDSAIVSNKPVIEIHVSAKNVIKLDVGSESDPMCVLFIQKDGKWIENSRTEVIWDNPNPSFVKTFKLEYVFEEQQPIKFSIYHCKASKAELENHDLVGYYETTIQQIATNLQQDLRFELVHDTEKGNRGTILISAEQLSQCSDFIDINAQISDLIYSSTPSPYLVFSRPSEGGMDYRVYRSEVLKKVKSGQFNSFMISMNSLCGGDDQTPITISVYNFVEGKTEQIIGGITISVKSINDSINQSLELRDSSRQIIGSLIFSKFQHIKRATFLDYLTGGLQLNMITAIDFTGSNGDPSESSSLHYRKPNHINQYEQCIQAVGAVVCPYDSDQLFPIYGFGANFDGTFSHCYPLTFNESDPNVNGLEGILQAYRNTLTKVDLSGPTNFTPIIRNATKIAIDSFEESKTYTILLIITDGEISDMNDTIDAIVDATDKPISIIIVGVGNANFKNMDILDADDVPLKSSKGVFMKRDIVQFVPFREFKDVSKDKLAAEVLEEVPHQVDEFCRAIGFVPKNIKN